MFLKKRRSSEGVGAACGVGDVCAAGVAIAFGLCARVLTAARRTKTQIVAMCHDFALLKIFLRI
jgi:hypothetical protein